MYISNCKINFNDWNGQTAFLGAFNSRFITSLDSGSWSNKQILSVNLRYAHFRSLLLVEIFEQPLIMLKNECSIFYAENISIGSGPGSRTLLKKCCLLVGNIYVWREDYTTLVLYTRSWNSDVWRIKLVTMSWYCITHVIEIVGEIGYIENWAWTSVTQIWQNFSTLVKLLFITIIECKKLCQRLRLWQIFNGLYFVFGKIFNLLFMQLFMLFGKFCKCPTIEKLILPSGHTV